MRKEIVVNIVTTIAFGFGNVTTKTDMKLHRQQHHFSYESRNANEEEKRSMSNC